MRSIVALLLGSAILAFSLSADSSGPGTIAFSATPETLLASAGAVDKGDADAVVLLDEVRYTFDEQGRATTTSRLVFQIVDESAVEEWATIETEWAPWYQERPLIEARVVARDGKVFTLDPKAITEAGAEDDPDIFSDTRMLRAPLPGLGAGAVVEQVITTRDANPLFKTGISGSMQFGHFVPVQVSRLVIDAPASLPVRVVDRFGPGVKAVTAESGGRRVVTYELGRTGALEDLEANLPYDEASIPYIAFSTGSSWQEVASRYHEVVEQQIGDAESIRAFAKSAIGDTTTPRAIAAAALAAIQKNVRYAGVEVGEGSIVPRPPSKVLALNYGDCKDKATLLVAMLRVAGIPARVALLKAGTFTDINPELPTLDRFNHAIVHVGGDQPFWVDPTDEFSPAGVLPVVDQDRLALIIDAATTGLTRTPVAASSDNFTRETRTFTLNEEGKSSVLEVTESAGSFDAGSRQYAATNDRKEYRKQMEDYARSEYLAESLKNITYPDPRDLKQPFRLSLEVTGAERGQTGDSDAVVAIFPSALTSSLPWKLREDLEDDDESARPRKARTRDFVITNPYVKEYVYRIVPPPGFVARTLPAAETRQLGTTTLTSKYESASDGTVVATFRFDSGKRRLTPAEFETTRKAIVALGEENALIVGFDSIGWSKLNKGDVRGAIGEFRRLSALHPKEALHKVQVARAYFVGGLAEAARTEMRAAIKLQPSYAPAHRYLGMILQYDLLGRQFRKGWDLEGAIAEYKEARKLDPKDVAIRAELATLLTLGSDGERWGAGARLADAIAEYKAIETDLDDDSYESELLTALAFAGQFDELKERARKVQDEKTRLLSLVIAAAATEGADAAVRAVSSADADTRRQVLGSAFTTLMNLRLYGAGATCLDQAATGGANAAQVRPLVEMLRRAKRYEDMELGNDPKSIVLKTSILAMSAADPETAGREYLAPWLIAFDDQARKAAGAAAATENKMTRAKMRTASQGIPVRVALEIGFSVMDLLIDGDDASGYRVRMRPKIALPVAPGEVNQTFFVARDGDRYVISGVSPATAAITVLHFADKGDLEPARKWLNWIREEMTAGGGDDPLNAAPFPSMWPKGKTTATADEIRTAAAMLLSSERQYAPAALPHLLAARESVGETLRIWVDVALAAVYSATEDAKSLVEVTRRMTEASPDSIKAFAMHTAALCAAGDAAGAKRLAEQRLLARPEDADALRALAMASTQTGDYQGAATYTRRIIEGSNGDARDYNSVAWNALFTGSALDAALEDANQAVALAHAYPALHTLASLYAEAGQSLEARAKLLEALDVAGRDDPGSNDWYVLGRIAENYGVEEAAVAAYKRVTKPKVIPGSTWELARRRLEVIAK